MVEMEHIIHVTSVQPLNLRIINCVLRNEWVDGRNFSLDIMFEVLNLFGKNISCDISLKRKKFAKLFTLLFKWILRNKV